MSRTLAEARARVRHRLVDDDQTFWLDGEIDTYLVQAYQEAARVSRAFWDVVFLENLPGTFTHTAPWEEEYVRELGVVGGCANYTFDDERNYLDDVIDQSGINGPAKMTGLFEAEWIAQAGGAVEIPATSSLPELFAIMERPVWNDQLIGILTLAAAAARDPRYEVTKGEVYALVTKGDGPRTVRKVRVPSAQALCHTIYSNHGIMRDPAACSDAAISGTWGIPRRIPGYHPLRGHWFGLPRRPYQGGLNVRVDHWREGWPVETDDDVFEFPDRFVTYLEYAAMRDCLAREGPAQDLTLANYYDARYQRGLVRVLTRIDAQTKLRASAFGGRTQSSRSGPPRPKLPWNYGQEIR